MVATTGDAYTLREPVMPYTPNFDGENGPLRLNNAVLWEKSLENTET